MTEEKSRKGLGAGAIAGVDDPVVFWLRAGYPRIALAFAKGIPWAPYVFNVKAQFPSASVTAVPDVGADVKLSQDVIIDDVVARVVVQRPAPNVLQPISDFFNQFQNGIEATLDVMGVPRYSVAPKFTPISTLVEIIKHHIRLGWALTYQQQVFMSFNLPFALPEFPTSVTVTFCGRMPQSEQFASMPLHTAVQLLRECGYDVPETCGMTYLNM